MTCHEFVWNIRESNVFLLLNYSKIVTRETCVKTTNYSFVQTDQEMVYPKDSNKQAEKSHFFLHTILFYGLGRKKHYFFAKWFPAVPCIWAWESKNKRCDYCTIHQKSPSYLKYIYFGAIFTILLQNLWVKIHRKSTKLQNCKMWIK